jgi:CheY-like chemotaxis protein
LQSFGYTSARVLREKRDPWQMRDPANRVGSMSLARVLLVDDDPTARLTLQTVLEASGYRVDSAASAAEAVGKMDLDQYELVLSDLQMESPDAGLKVLAHAKMMEYEPAASLFTSSRSGHARDPIDRLRMLIAPEDVPELLTRVADLISERATRIVTRGLKHACV